MFGMMIPIAAVEFRNRKRTRASDCSRRVSSSFSQIVGFFYLTIVTVVFERVVAFQESIFSAGIDRFHYERWSRDPRLNRFTALWGTTPNEDGVNGELPQTTFVARPSIDIEDVFDPEFLDRKPSYYSFENYDNDFDTSAFKTLVPGLHSCVVDYDMGSGGLAIPFMTSYKSDSTWIEYGPDGSVVSPAGPIGQFKENLANLLKEPRVEVTISFSVLLSCALVAVSTFENFPYRDALLFIEDFITAIFAVDFFGRWFSSSRDFGRHILNPQFAIDVVVVVLPLMFALAPNIDKSSLPLPGWMTSPSTLINLELLRVLRLRRVFQDATTYTSFARALGIRNIGVQLWQLQLARVLFSLFTLLSVSTGLIYTAEHDVNPAIPDYFTALYFSISTLATLGLGDITPITWQGRLVVCGTIIAGVAIVPAQAAALVDALVSRRDTLRELSKRSSRNRSPSSTERADGPEFAASSFKRSTTEHSRLMLEIETSFQCQKCGSTMHWSSARYCWSCGSKL